MAEPRKQEESAAQTEADELRRKYGELTSSFDQLRNKILAFIAGEIALIAFLFDSGVRVPNVIFGTVFFAAGVGCIGASFIVLILSLRGVDWHSPGPSRASGEQENIVALKKISDDYASAIEVNTPTYASRSRMFDTALLLLLIGVILLLVIKYGQGEIQWQNIIKN